MPDVIYLPSERRATLGSDIGGLIGASIASDMQQKQLAAQRQDAMMMIQGIQKAPDRASAMEVVTNYAPKFKTTQDYTAALHMVDEMHPVSMETPTPTTAYTPQGDPTTVFPNRRQMVDPNFWAGKGVSLTKPEVADFYKAMPGATPDAEPTYQNVGRAPVSNRPADTFTLPEITLQQKARAEARAQDNADRQDKRLSDSEKRTTAVMSRLADSQSEAQAGRMQGTMKAIRSNTALILNAKTLPDGSFGFDSDNQKETYVKVMDYVAAKVDSNPKALRDPAAVEKLTSEAFKTVAPEILKAPADKQPPAAPVAAKRTLIPTSKIQRAEDLFDPKNAEGKLTMSDADKKASVLNASIAADRIRKDATMTTNEKSAKIGEIRQRLRSAGINEDI